MAFFHSHNTAAASREQQLRANDQLKILQAQKSRHPWRAFWLLLGPGLLVMLGENDAPSMLSYAATGAQFGIGFFLPFVALTFVMAFIAQEITVRLGAQTGTGHAELIYRRYGKFWGNFAMFDLLFTNFLTLITEFVGIITGAGYFGVPAWLAVLGGITVIAASIMFRRYMAWERILLSLAIFNLIFIPLAFLAHPHWASVAHAFIDWAPLPGGWNRTTILILLSNIGATITPWMLFFQQGAVSDKGLHSQHIRQGRWDTAIGAFLATLAAVACIIAVSPLYLHHMNAASFGTAQFAQSLAPYIGHFGSALFALGILEAGLVAAAAISTSSAYAFGEVARRTHSLNGSFKESRAFYLILLSIAALAGSITLIPGFPLEWVVLLVNVVAVLTMPPAIGFLLLLANDKEVIGTHHNTPLLNILGIGVGVFVSIAGIIYALSIIF
ncbi:MAG: divalent metal cation transporter [Firmicutes bacterium]|nr:divalent metal cation transporter [Bacillota bacterium]